MEKRTYGMIIIMDMAMSTPSFITMMNYMVVTILWAKMKAMAVIVMSRAGNLEEMLMVSPELNADEVYLVIAVTLRATRVTRRSKVVLLTS